jgi:hypothetical protein
MKTQINTTTNNVIVQNINRTLTIVDHNCNNINVTQPLVNVIEVVSPGPQGLQGLQGDSIFIYIEDETYSTTSSIQITGSLAVSQPITGSLYGTSSWALSASWAPFPDIDTGSLVTTSSFNSFTSSYNTGSFTGSFTGDGSDLQNIPASSIIGLNLSQIISGSVSASISPENGLQVNTQIVAPSFTGSLLGTASYSTQALSSSYSQTASYAENTQTASFAPSYLPLTGGIINGDLIVNGTASISFLNVTYESASVIYSSGSNQFGDASDDTQTLWGTVDIKSGPVKVTGSLSVSSSFTASGLNYPAADNGEESFMQTDGSGNLSLQYVKTIYEEIVNGESTQLVKGTPVYVSGSVGAASIVYRADPLNPLKMPAVYIAADTLSSGEPGRGIALGLIKGVNTTGYPAGSEIYLAAGGGWTLNRPTGSAIVQVLGYVTKEGNGGQGVVLNPGPANLPNLSSGSVWVGNSSSIPVPVLTSSLFVNSASFATTASYVLNAISSSFSSTASYSDFSPTVYTIGARIYTENLYIENGSKGYRHIGSNGDIVKVITLANTNGNINMEIRRNGTILGTSSLFNQSSSIDSTLSGWTTNLNTDDLIEFYVPSSSIYINDFSIFIDIKTKQ